MGKFSPQLEVTPVVPRHLEATKRRSKRRRQRTRCGMSQLVGVGWVLTPAPNEQGVWVENGSSKEIYSPGK